MTKATKNRLVLVEKLLGVNKMPSNVLVIRYPQMYSIETFKKECAYIVKVVCTNCML